MFVFQKILFALFTCYLRLKIRLLALLPMNTHYSTLNPFQTNILFLYPQKTSENQRFSNVFRGYRKETLT